MTDIPFYTTMAAATLAGLAMLTAAMLTGWHGWLALKREELGRHPDAAPSVTPTAGARIEIADLKERIRKLEAIAAGVEL